MSTSLFSGEPWPDPELQELTQESLELLEEHLHTRHFTKGSLLWMEGDMTGMLVAVTSGRVKVYRLLPSARAVTLFLFGPGDLFGFLPLLDGLPYPAYAQALEDVEARVMDRATLLNAVRREPDLAITLLALLGRRLRTSFERIQALSTPGAPARVAQALCAILGESGAATGEVELPVTAHEFAGALGLVPETFSRALTNLVGDGILERAGGGRYRVLNVEALRRVAAAAG